MTVFSYEEVKKYDNQFYYVPLCREIYSDITTPISLLRKLAASKKNYFLLESVENGKNQGRYSFIGYDPVKRIYCEDNQVIVEEKGEKEYLDGEPLEVLKGVLQTYSAPKIPTLPTFSGGFVGYFSYELIGLAEPKLQLKKSEFPIFDLMLFDTVLVFDHLTQKICVIVNMKLEDGEKGYHQAIEKIDQLVEFIYDTTPLPNIKVEESPQFTCNMTKAEFCSMVEKAKHYIYEGDIFQAVVSRRFEAEYKGSLLNTYRVMRTINPSSYMYYIKCEDIEIAGVSPETLVKLVDGKLTTFPVAGTRKRGATIKEDKELEVELLSDEKELAEHNMLVDLARNDIGKLSKMGTVEVEEYMQIHRFSKVMHIASIVTGKKKEAMDSIDTITMMLPAGTLSGAPKFRACEIIDELEKTPRGIYGGAIGYLDFSGNLDVCIRIRTAVKKGDRVYVQAGGGVVADSIPENEYEESGNKAKAVLEAIKRASEVNAL